MMDAVEPSGLLSNATTILGFGFLGLAFLFAMLGFMAFKKVSEAENPKADVVKLARFFMMVSIGLIILAGPLQLLLLWAEATFGKSRPVNVHIAMANRTWDPTVYGEIGILVRGEFKPLQDKVLDSELSDKDVVMLQMEKAISSFDKLRTQLTNTTLAVSRACGPAASGGDHTPTPVNLTAGNAAIDGG